MQTTHIPYTSPILILISYIYLNYQTLSSHFFYFPHYLLSKYTIRAQDWGACDLSRFTIHLISRDPSPNLLKSPPFLPILVINLTKRSDVASLA